jgi:endonuclease/exonuclease/phosphatase (EEP) superfamily protein YafD
MARLMGDQVSGVATIYYAMPLQVLAALTATLAALNWGTTRRVIRWSVCTLLLLLGIVFEDFRRVPDRSSESDLKVVFWNACRIHRGWDGVTAEVRSWDADVIALVEAGQGTETNRKKWQDGCPGYRVSLLGAGIVLLTRGESGRTTVHEFPDGSRARQIRTTVRGQELQLVVTDIQANPLMSRREPLALLTEVVTPLAEGPTLVLGDFNTPVQSELLKPMRTNFVSAFDAAGQGYRPTWPQPFPVLAIDQAWVSPQLEVTSCRHLWTNASDHRPVYLTIKSEPEPVVTQARHSVAKPAL